MAEKTEKATSKKLRDAKKKGQIAKSQDFPAAFTFVVSVMATLFLSGSLFQQMSAILISTFKATGDTDLTNVITSWFMQAFYVIFTCSMPIMCAVAFAGTIVTFLIQGPVFAPEVFKFDIKKFNPVDNLKSKFKMKIRASIWHTCCFVSFHVVLVVLCIESGTRML